MKNFTLGLNIALLLAVGILFYLVLSKKDGGAVKQSGSMSNAAGKTGISVAYFEMDSVENNYEYLKDIRADLRGLEQKKANALNSLRSDARNKLMDYQKKGNSMTEEEAQRANQEMMQIDNNLKSQEQQASQELQDESIKKLQEVKKAIEEYLKEYNKAKGFTYILSSSNDIFYYKDTTLNITNEIIKGLNEAYKKKKSK